MTTDETRILAVAFANFGSRDDATALLAARAAARLIAAAGVTPGSLAAMVAANVTQAQALRERPFSELGAKGMRKRLALLARRRGISDADKDRLTSMRQRMQDAPRVVLDAAELAWLDALWTAPVPARARKAS